LGEIIMALYNPEPGLGMISEYRVSGIPVVGEITTDQTATFTKVTRAVTFSACDEALNPNYGSAAISFDEGATSYTFGSIQDTDASTNNAHRVMIKCTSITNTGTLPIQFIAELTTIDASRCPTWTFADFCTIV
jgi:hypothetical protein